MIAAVRRWVDPFIVLLIAAMLMSIWLPASGAFAEALDIVKLIAIAVLFLVYGMRIPTREAWEGLKNWRLHGVILTATYVFFPLLGVVSQPLLRPVLGDALAIGVLFLTLLPSTVQSSVAFTSIARGNVAAAICGASLSNILGMFITPVLVAMFMNTSGGGFRLSAIGSILTQMLVPFVVGQCLQPWAGEWIRAHRWVSTVSDRGTILLVVYSAFSAGIIAGIWTGMSTARILLLVAASVVLLGIVLATTWGVGGKLGFPRPDRITLLMCGSKKSLATGVPMASVLFAPHIAAAVTLPVMVFHQVQLFACAIIARKLQASDQNDAATQD